MDMDKFTIGLSKLIQECGGVQTASINISMPSGPEEERKLGVLSEFHKTCLERTNQPLRIAFTVDVTSIGKWHSRRHD